MNGRIQQDSDLGKMIWNVPEVIHHLSAQAELKAGDLIFTGTPGGIGAAMKPMQFLKAGDRVRIEIETLGAIENPCAPEA